ncbi:MAG: VOC family protein, partial [Gammaproteobacteria bacterium]|nr:VOC family protein [Gammaproteobacteria bacterium]
GRPKTWPYPTIPEKGRDRTHGGNHPSERRIADRHAKGAKTVWQLAYAGSVGSQVLLGLPALKRLLTDPMLRGRGAVWPFDTGLRAPDAPLVLAEVYPSLLRREIDLRRHDDEILDRAQVRVNAKAFARLDADGGLAPLFAGTPSLTPAERRVVETEEAWILGLGHEEMLECAIRRSECRLPQQRAGRPLECLTRCGVILCTERYEECVDFYRRMLGLPELFSLDNEHSTLTCLDMGGSYLMIETGGAAVSGAKPIERSPVTLRFNVRDVEAAAEALESRGVSVAVRREPWGTVGDFIDPDGNRCSLRDEGSFFPP